MCADTGRVYILAGRTSDQWWMRLRPAPLSKLLPRLDQFLHGTCRREGLAIDDAAFAVCTFVEFAHAVFAEKRKVPHDLFQILAGPHLFFLSGIRAPCHRSEVSIFAFCSPTVFCYEYAENPGMLTRDHGDTVGATKRWCVAVRLPAPF